MQSNQISDRDFTPKGFPHPTTTACYPKTTFEPLTLIHYLSKSRLQVLFTIE